MSLKAQNKIIFYLILFGYNSQKLLPVLIHIKIVNCQTWKGLY